MTCAVDTCSPVPFTLPDLPCRSGAPLDNYSSTVIVVSMVLLAVTQLAPKVED